MSSGTINNGSSASYTYKQRVGCAESYYGSGSWANSIDLVEWVGFNTPGFRSLVRKGALLPMTPWGRWSQTGSAGGSFDYHGSVNQDPCGLPNRYWSEGPDPGHSVSFAPSQSEVRALINVSDYNYLVTEAASRIYDQAWDALTFLAELHKVKAMLNGVLPRLVEYVRKARLDKAWLEYRYGWRPLLYDMQDIAKAINAIDDSRKRFEANTSASTADTSTSTFVAVGGSHDMTYTTNNTWTVSVRGHCIADYQPSKLRINPITTAWELIPFSFVVDWFIGVGQWLNSLSLRLFSAGMVASLGFRVEYYREVTSTVTWKTYLGNNWSGSRTWSGSSHTTFVSRVPASAVQPTPSLRLKLDTLKIIDLGALLTANGGPPISQRR